jgi:predicted TIM-barrel fold metal-dependent hydrolase
MAFLLDEWAPYETGPQEIEKLIQRKGSEFFLFGSDNSWRRPEESWDRFLRLDLSSSDRENIAGLNLQRILGLCPLE